MKTCVLLVVEKKKKKPDSMQNHEGKIKDKPIEQGKNQNLSQNLFTHEKKQKKQTHARRGKQKSKEEGEKKETRF